MADFCNKCAEEMGFPEPDIEVYTIWESLEPGFYQSGYICEGCGFLGISHGLNGEVFVLMDAGNDGIKLVDYNADYKGLNTQ